MPSKEIAIKTFAQISSYVVLLFLSSAFGFMSMPGQMTLAIAAGAIGLAFTNIDKISRFKGAGFEAEMRGMVQTIIESQTEPTTEQQESAKQIEGSINESENRILTSLQKPGYVWRYAKTVAGEVSLPVTETETALKSLMKRGLAKNGQGSNGEIWAATALGKSVQEQYALKKA